VILVVNIFIPKNRLREMFGSEKEANQVISELGQSELDWLISDGAS